MVDVLLLYPFFSGRFDNSPFRFPPLGAGYIASTLQQGDFSVQIIDCTFRGLTDVLRSIRKLKPRIIGIYSMYSMERDSLLLAKKVRTMTDLLVAGGPLPTLNPFQFLPDFDMVVQGEAEQTMLEITKRFLNNRGLRGIKGTIYQDNGTVVSEGNGAVTQDLDLLPFPRRELFDNQSYLRYYQKHFGLTMTSMISSRGCPFTCDFCSKPIFGDTLRYRSPPNIVNEMESINTLGYDTVWFADDCFTLSSDRVMRICDEILSRGLRMNWQCLSRADTFDSEIAVKMKEAGCTRIYFGLESGDNTIIKKIMKKNIELKTAKQAVYAAKRAGIETGAFFMVGYPGETDDTILNTIKFATSLPLNYVSFTLPYPIPGTGLYSKVKDRLKRKGKITLLPFDQNLLFQADFSECKLKFAIMKAAVQVRIKRYLREKGYHLIGTPFEQITDRMFKVMK